MVLSVLLLSLSAAPLTLQLDAFTSEVDGLSSERLGESMRSALAQALAGDGALVPRGGAVKVSGRFAAGGTKRFRLLIAVTKGDEPSLLAFDFTSPTFGEAGTRAIAAAVVQRARSLPEVAPAAPAPAPAPLAPASAPPTAQRPAPGADVAPEEAAEDEARSTEAAVARNAIYVEGLGAGLLYSLNYERVLVGSLALRVGASYSALSATAGASSASSFQLSVPIGVSWFGARRGPHAFETGAGATVRYGGGGAFLGGMGGQAAVVLPTGWLQLGYRYHPVGGAGFHFRIGVMALVGPVLGLGVRLGNDAQSLWLMPWGYLSLGAAF